jgi:DNA invertase Pin-like site-specific DNA recombinase
MKIGFARQSTLHQKFGLEHQVELLKSEGCEKIFAEEVSALASKRPEFEKAIEFVREGDIFVVTALSRFGRSLNNILANAAILEKKGVAFKILDLNVDSSTASGKLIFNLMGSIYQFEREMLLERQQIGIARAKAEGKFFGRKPTAREKAPQIIELFKDGKSPKQIAESLKISLASVYRYRFLPQDQKAQWDFLIPNESLREKDTNIE